MVNRPTGPPCGAAPLQVFVTLTAADGSTHELPASIRAKDPSHELIILQVEPPPAGLAPLMLGSSAGLRPGQDAILLGALPTGEPAVSTGALAPVGLHGAGCGP